MNQCDGCRAGRHLVSLVHGEWRVDSKGNTHAMGDVYIEGGIVKVKEGSYVDLMRCERHLYQP